MMKFARTNLKLAGFTASLFVLFCGLLPTATAHAAGNAVLYTQPDLKAFTKGSRFSVAVRINTHGEAINAVEADLDYSQSILQFDSIVPAGSAFDIDAPSSGGAGTVKIARGATHSVSGDLLVANIVFTAKANGRAILQFMPTSQAPRFKNATDALGSTIGAIYTVYQAGTKPPSLLPPTPPNADAHNYNAPPTTGGSKTSTTTPNPAPSPQAAPAGSATTSNQPGQDTGILTRFTSQPKRTALGSVVVIIGAAVLIIALQRWHRRKHITKKHRISGAETKSK